MGADSKNWKAVHKRENSGAFWATVNELKDTFHGITLPNVKLLEKNSDLRDSGCE